MAKGMTPPPFTFRIVAGPLEGKEIFNTGKKFRVGRTKASSIQIKDPAVSEKHAEIVFVDGEWRIRDLGSSNGTQLNGVDVKGDFVGFKAGDEFRFGTETFVKVEMELEEEEDTENLTVQQFLEAECEKLEHHIRSHAEQLGNTLMATWKEEKAELALYA